jgi:hypothetical protein
MRRNESWTLEPPGCARRTAEGGCPLDKSEGAVKDKNILAVG